MTKMEQEVIEEGLISLHSDQKEHPYVLRVLSKEDIPKVLHLQEEVTKEIERKELFVPITTGEMISLVEKNGESVGLFIKDRLYAACSILFNVPDEISMARELNFNQEALSQVAQFELSLVDPDLRGHRLQYKMAEILGKRSFEKKKFRYLFTTVSPFNYASIQTVLALGLKIAKLSKMYFDWDRYIVYQDFVNPIKLDQENPLIIVSTDIADQERLLKKNYCGFAATKEDGHIKIQYAKTLPSRDEGEYEKIIPC